MPARALPLREEPGDTMADAVQLVIALFTAGLDSPELEAWAAHRLTPVDADGLADFMAGLHVTADEADAWLSKLEAGKKAAPPKCHD